MAFVRTCSFTNRVLLLAKLQALRNWNTFVIQVLAQHGVLRN